MPQLDPLFSQLQEDIASTSKAEIHRRINCARGKKHFTKWTKNHQNMAIKACGLASSKYTNKSSRNKILEILSKTDLPTGIAEVWQKIKEMRINASNATSLQQRAYLLLYNMVSPAVRAAWSTVVSTLGTNSGLQLFLEGLSAKYVEDINSVYAHTHTHTRALMIQHVSLHIFNFVQYVLVCVCV